MRALAASGNVAEALAAYERLRILLRENWELTPARPCRTRTSACWASRPQGFAKASSSRRNYAGECLNHDNNKQTNQRPASY